MVLKSMGPGYRLAVLILAVFICCVPVFSADLQLPVYQMPGGALILTTEAPIFDIYTTPDTRDKSARRLTNRDFRKVDHRVVGNQRIIQFSNPPDEWGGEITATVTYEDTGKEVLTQLSIDNGSYFPIKLVRFPVVDTPEVKRYDDLLVSTTVGDLIHDPLVMISTRLSGIYSRRYPAEIAMQYMVFFNAHHSLYMACYGDGDEFYDHTVRSAGKNLRLSFDWYPFLESGKWESPQCSLSMLAGDWHSAADLYREHMGPKFRPPALPKWMKESFHGWVQLGMKGGNNPPAFRFSELPWFYKNYVEANGLNTLHIFSWCVDGLDHHFPDRKPSPYLGKPEELTQALDEIRKMGGYADLYTNGRSVDIDSDFFRNGGDRALVITEGGGFNFEGVPDYMPKACPYSKLYQDELLKWFKVILEKYHATGCQVDQNACTPALFCYDTSHGHRTPASNWSTGTDALFRQLHDYYRSKNPDFFVWVEGMNERFSQFYEVNQSHGEEQSWSAGESLPEQFHYTYPDHLCTGIADSIESMVHTFGQGKPFDFQWRRLLNLEYKTLLRKLIKVREDESEYFLRGRFMDNVGLTVSGNDIRCWRIDRRDGGGMLVNFWARGRGLLDTCEVSLKTPDGMRLAREVYPTNLNARERDGWVRATWSGPVATLVFEKQ